MKTGYAIIVAGFFVGAAIQFAGGDIAAKTGGYGGGGSLLSGVGYLVAGVLGLILHHNAEKAKKGQQN